MQTILPQAHRSSAQGQYHHQLAAWAPVGIQEAVPRTLNETARTAKLQAGLAVDLAPEVAQQDACHTIPYTPPNVSSRTRALDDLCVSYSNIQHIVSSQLDENLLCQDETQFQPISSRPHRRGHFVR